MAAWCWTTVTENQTILWVGQSSEAGNLAFDQFTLKLNGAGAVQALSASNTGATTANTSTTYPTSTWFHAAAVFDVTTGTDRAAFLNGGGKVSNTTNRVPAGIDRTSIGLTDNTFATQPFGGTGTGYLAGVGLWNTNLTDAEIAVLAAGVSPMLVRPGNLVSYWPLIGQNSPEIDLVGGFNMSIQGTLTQANHPRIYYPHGRQRYIPVPAVGGADVPLGIANTDTGHTSTAFGLSYLATVRAANATVGHTAQALGLTAAYTLNLATGTQGHEATGFDLTRELVVTIVNAEAGHTALPPSLSRQIVLGFANSVHGHRAEPLIIFVPRQGPYDLSVSPETRVLAVTNDGRAFAIPARVESFTVNGEPRLLVVPKRSGTVIVYEDRRVGPESRTFIVPSRQIGNVQRQGSATTSTTPPDTDFLLLEDGNFLLQEDGSRIRL